MNNKILLRTIGLVFLFSASQSFANWTLDNSQSQLHFISTKNVHISETHHFTQLAGSLDKAGHLIVKVSLNSVETGIPIRNTRMKEKLFNTAAMPEATFTSNIGNDVIAMPVANQKVITVDGMFTINGVSKTLPIEIHVTKLADNSYVANTTRPVLIQSADFELVPGIDILKNIAGLNNIGYVVPLTFSVVFTPQS